jgi:hypothetical protein
MNFVRWCIIVCTVVAIFSLHTKLHQFTTGTDPGFVAAEACGAAIFKKNNIKLRIQN